MDILLNPNFIYLLLTGGLVLAVLALAAPGTGILEALALTILGGAALGLIYNQQSLNIWALLVFLAGVGLFILALRRPRQPVYLLLAILAWIVGSVYIFESDVWWKPAVNPFLAIVVSALSAGFFWMVGRKVIEAGRLRPSHDLISLMEDTGEAKTLVYTEGSVQIGGELWSAYSDVPIPAGTRVRMISRDGFRLKVAPAEPQVQPAPQPSAPTSPASRGE
jgi:membrane-bound serine protease (ClpP class)